MDKQAYIDGGSGKAGNNEASGLSGGMSGGNMSAMSGESMSMQTVGMKPKTCNALKWTLFGIGCAYTLLLLGTYLYSMGTTSILMLALGVPLPCALDFIIAAWWFSAHRSGRTGFVMMAVADLFAVASIMLSLYCMFSFAVSPVMFVNPSIPLITVAALLLAMAVADIVIMALLQADMYRKFRAGVYETRPEPHGNMVVSIIWVVLSAALVAIWLAETYLGVGSYKFYTVFFIPTFLLCIAILPAWWFAPYRSRGTAICMSVIVMIMAVILFVSGLTEGIGAYTSVSMAVLAVSVAWFAFQCAAVVLMFMKMRRIRKTAVQQGESQD